MKTVIGLTGMSGSGKTTVSKRFSDAGFYVINCDQTARQAVKSGSPLIEGLAKEFGCDIINENGELNRRLLASRAFATAQGTAALNGIMLPYIVELIKNEIASVDSSCILLDAPTLFQAGADSLCCCTVAVVADAERCIKRITQRDGITVEDAKKRLDSQFGSDYFSEKCTYIITNNGNISDLQVKADEIINLIKKGDYNGR